VAMGISLFPGVRPPGLSRVIKRFDSDEGREDRKKRKRDPSVLEQFYYSILRSRLVPVFATNGNAPANRDKSDAREPGMSENPHPNNSIAADF
jgi:hypothetical protein